MKPAEIIRGDDQTISIPVTSLFPNLVGAQAYLFVVPKGSTAPDVLLDPAALITATTGVLSTNVTTLDFNLTSATGAASSLIPVGTYNWYGRVKTADNKLTSIQLSSNIVKVVTPEGDSC